MLQVVFEVSAAVFGACVGSFLNVVIYRLPKEDPRERRLGGRSRCPHCGVQIEWRDNLPVLGWLLRRGRARCCGGAIALRYPGVELLTALLFLALARWHPYGPVVQPETDLTPATLDATNLAALVLQAVFVSMLVACTFIDLDHRILPDALTKPGMALFVVSSAAVPGLAGYLGDTPSSSQHVDSVAASLVGLAVGMGVTWAIREAASRVFAREAMGLGDVKFLGFVGAAIGWRGVLLALFLGCIVGAAVGGLQMWLAGRRRAPQADPTMIPFGPYLALGALIALFAGGPILKFLFETWPEWQRHSQAAPWILSASALLSLLALVVLIRRARRRT